MRIASLDGSTGWVAGIVGVHPWEMAMCDPQVQEEIWGQDQDTWIASPYAPMGVLRPVDGGYIFNGRWQFSSGTDHCDWIFLGAFMGDAEGNRVMPPRNYHVILPRSDYEIVEDSWDVVGLRGTGSQGHHRQGRLHPREPRGGVLELPRRHPAARGRADQPAVPHPVHHGLPARHQQRRRRHRRGRARRAPGLPAPPRAGDRHQGHRRPLRALRRSAPRPRRSASPAWRCSTT